MDIGSGELFLILLVALLVYGGRLPEVALAVGRTIGGFKRTLQETTDLIRAETEFGLDDDLEDDRDEEDRRVVRRAAQLESDDDGREEYDAPYDEFGVATTEPTSTEPTSVQPTNDEESTARELATEDVSGEDPPDLTPETEGGPDTEARPRDA